MSDEQKNNAPAPEGEEKQPEEKAEEVKDAAKHSVKPDAKPQAPDPAGVEVEGEAEKEPQAGKEIKEEETAEEEPTPKPTEKPKAEQVKEVAKQAVKPETKPQAPKPAAAEKPKPKTDKPVEKPKPPAKKEKKEEPPPRTFTLSSSPHIRDNESVSKVMNTVTLTLLPVVIASTYFFGFRALVICLLGMAAAMATEGVLQRVFKMPVTVGDGSAMLAGLLVSFNLPAGVPWWIPVVGSMFAIAIAKMPFGGLGWNPMNPALVGRAFLLASWPVHMTKDWLPAGWWKLPGYDFFTWNVNPADFGIDLGKEGIVAGMSSGGMPDAISYATPLELNKSAMQTVSEPVGAEGVGLVNMAMDQLEYLKTLLGDAFFGNIGGCIGETSALLLILGGIFLIYKNYIDWRVPLSFIAVVGLGGWLLGIDPVFYIFSGGLILGAFYMATDMVTSPITKSGRLWFGVGCGLLTLMIRQVGGYPEGVCYAILLMNLVSPLIDRWTTPRRFGRVKTAKEA